MCVIGFIAIKAGGKTKRGNVKISTGGYFLSKYYMSK